jgi:rubredoxin
MGEIADDMVNGFSCSLCGIYFQEEHGYPVVCETCWNDLNKREKKQYQKAHISEL